MMRVTNQNNNTFDIIDLEQRKIILLKGDFAISKFENLLRNYRVVPQKGSPFDSVFLTYGQKVSRVRDIHLSYEDVCRLLEWENNEVPLNLGGYKYDRKTKTFPVFINYDKAEDIQATIKYEDHFESPGRLIAISKQSRTKASEDVQNFLHARERGIDVELFVRKNKDDRISKEFYYLGRMTATGKAEEFVMANTDKTAVEIEWELDTPVREDIYEYIVNS